MLAGSLLLAAAAVGTASAVPVNKYDYGLGKLFSKKWNNSHGLATTDFAILQLASNLELLEWNYWLQGLANFSTNGDFQNAGFDANYVNYIEFAVRQEINHYAELNSLLYGQGPKNCTYDFGVTSPKQFNSMAQVITSVGEAAYLGSGALFQNRDYIAVTATILGNEARQNSFLREATGTLDFYNAPYFDTALTGSQAYSLAAPLIKSCPSSNFPLKSAFTQFPMLKASYADGAAKYDGSKIDLTWPSSVSTKGAGLFFVSQLSSYKASLSVTGSKNGMTMATTELPHGVNGTAFLVVSTASGTPFPIPDSTVKAIGSIVVD